MAEAPRGLRGTIIDAAYLGTGVLCCGFALSGFVLPNGFFDGGTTGVSLVLHAFTRVNVGWLILPLNLPFIALGARLVNVAFALKTLACILGLSLCLLVVPYPVVTSDRLLVAIFGGVFMGLGGGLAMRGGAALDGIEIFALFTVRRLPFTSSEMTLALNALIFLIAALTLGPEQALYSMLIYFTGSRASDFVVNGLEEYTSVTIVSSESEAIKRVLVMELGRGITVYKGERGFLPGSFELSQPVDVIAAVVTRLEVRRLRNRVHAIDPKAFIVTASAKEAVGGVLRRRAGV